MTSESDLQAQVIRALEEHRAYVVNVVMAGRSGTPDLIVCWQGRFVALEVKMPGKVAEPLQRVELMRVRRAGGVDAVVTSPEEAIAALQTFTALPEPTVPLRRRGAKKPAKVDTPRTSRRTPRA